jgi:hypothetical protein
MHFRDGLSGGVFKANMKVGGNMYAATQSADEQVHITSTLRPVSRSSRRLNWTRLR